MVESTDHKASPYVALLPVTSFLLGPNILLSTLFSYTLILCSSFSVGVQVLYTVLHIFLSFMCG